MEKQRNHTLHALPPYGAHQRRGHILYALTSIPHPSVRATSGMLVWFFGSLAF